MRVSFLSMGFVSALGLMLGSCQNEDASPQSGLVGTRWMLVQVENTPLAISSYSETYRSYIQFNANANTTEGLGPCNSFGGTFALGTQTGQLSISPQAATKATCPALNIETAYLNALPRTVFYQRSGKELLLFDAPNGLTPILRFQKAE